MEIATVVNQWSDELSLWPFSFGVEFLRETVPSTFIRNCDLCEVILLDRLIEMHNEL